MTRPQTEIRNHFSASFRLDALTLHGIGPYFREARLEVRPLTILCGENGSGKSTWAKILQFLQEASVAESFPFIIPDEILPLVSMARSIVNSGHFSGSENYYDETEGEDFKRYLAALATAEDITARFGAPGTVALEATVLRDVNLFEGNVQILDSAWEFRPGDKLRLAITFKSTFVMMGVEATDTISKIEIFKNDNIFFAMSQSHTILATTMCGATAARQSASHVILDYGFSTFVERKHDGGGGVVIPAQLITESRMLELGGEVAMCHECAKRFSFILYKVSGAAHILFASRSLLDDSFLYEGYTPDNALEDISKQVPKELSVGVDGRSALVLERLFSANVMIEAGAYTKESHSLQIENKINEHLERLGVPSEEREARADRMRRWHAGDVSDEEIGREHEEGPLAAFFREHRIPHSSEPHDLVDWFVSRDMYHAATYHEGFATYRLAAYFHYWMDVLLNKGRIYGSNFKFPPCGYMADRQNMARTRGASEDVDNPYSDGPFSRYRHLQGPLSYGSPVATLSSGFHHLAPIVTQTGLMWNGDSFFIESPEAHLHPSLQVKLVDFLILHANSGRQFILETHSDLVVRRVLRAILEEEISQEDVRIYFSRIVSFHARDFAPSAEVDFSGITASLEAICIDEKGHIENWPEGFMDATIMESRRLMTLCTERPLMNKLVLAENSVFSPGDVTWGERPHLDTSRKLHDTDNGEYKTEMRAKQRPLLVYGYPSAEDNYPIFYFTTDRPENGDIEFFLRPCGKPKPFGSVMGFEKTSYLRIYPASECPGKKMQPSRMERLSRLAVDAIIEQHVNCLMRARSSKEAAK